jgi:hypothetical protein
MKYMQTNTNQTRRIHLTETGDVHDAQVFFCKSASYKGSAPFSAIFEVWDVDHALRTDPKTGMKTLTVSCQWGTQTVEDATLEIEIADSILHAGEGYSGRVAKRINWQD